MYPVLFANIMYARTYGTPCIYISFVKFNPTFLILSENAGFFRIEAEFSRKGTT